MPPQDLHGHTVGAVIAGRPTVGSVGAGQRADNGVAHWRPRDFLLSHFVFLLSLFVLLSSHFAFSAAFGTNLFCCCRAGTADACPAQQTQSRLTYQPDSRAERRTGTAAHRPVMNCTVP
eukprot:scaffold9278_cov117-Isochrysis_galbana.AAC.4